MFVPVSLSPGKIKDQLNLKRKNNEFNKRLCKSFNYGRKTKIDYPSLSATEFLCSYFRELSCVPFDRVDKYWASDVGYDACISPCAIVFAMMYAERLRINNPDYLTKTASQELFIVSMMLASKFIYESGDSNEVFNEEWAKSCNVNVKDLNRMEARFLTAIDWKLFVSTSEFWNMLESIEKRIVRRKFKKNQATTYTDLVTLSSDFNLMSLLIDLLKITLFATITYTTMMVLIASSVMSYAVLSSSLSTGQPTTTTTSTTSTTITTITASTTITATTTTDIPSSLTQTPTNDDSPPQQTPSDSIWFCDKCPHLRSPFDTVSPFDPVAPFGPVSPLLPSPPSNSTAFITNSFETFISLEQQHQSVSNFSPKTLPLTLEPFSRDIVYGFITDSLSDASYDKLAAHPQTPTDHGSLDKLLFA